MASVHRVKGSRKFFGLVSLPGGKRIFRSTGQTDEAAALKVAMEWERVAKGAPPESSEQARRVLADIVKMTMGEAQTRISCRDYGKRWIEAQRGTVADSTLDFYSSAVAAWLEWLGDRAEKPLDGIQREDLVAYRTAEAKRVSGTTANHKLKVIRQMFKAAAIEGFVGENPAEGVKSLRKPRKQKKVRRPFALDELQKVAGVMDEEWRLILWIGLYTGQRLGDVLRLRKDEYDRRKGALHLEAGKSGARVWIPVPAGVLEAIDAWITTQPEGPWIFPEQVEQLEAAKGKVGRHSKRFAHFLWKAGLRGHSPFGSGQRVRGRQAKEREDDRREPQELSFHSLRHTARTLLEEAGVAKAVIDAFIGHEGDTGRIYTTVGEEALRAAAGTLEKAAQRLTPWTSCVAGSASCSLLSNRDRTGSR